MVALLLNAASVWTATLLVCSSLEGCASDANEFRLYSHLMLRYDPLERPVRNTTAALPIQLSVILQQIIDVDEKNEILVTNAWLHYAWNDYKLRWKPEEYGGIQRVRFPVGQVWSPDILLYNSADKSFDTTYQSDILVYSSGDTTWIPPGILKSSCSIDITWFPFDDQSCYLKFGAWTHHGFEVDLRPADPNGIDMSEYLENGEWLLMSTPVRKDVKHYDCCPEPYPTLWFYINIRRRTLYYTFNLIIPSMLIALMTILGFTLPPEAGEKIGLEITILLSVCFFLSMVADMTPPTSDAVPLIGAFFSCCMFVVSASVVFTVVVLNLHHRTGRTHEMPPSVRGVLLEWVPWLLLMRRPGFDLDRRQREKASARRAEEAPGGSQSLLSNVRAVERAARFDARLDKCIAALVDKGGGGGEAERASLSLLRAIETEMRRLTRRLERGDAAAEATSDWQFAARVVDRLCLVVFSVFICFFTCAIMFSAPHLIA